MKHFKEIVTIWGTFAFLTALLIHLSDNYLMPYLCLHIDAESASLLVTVLFSIYAGASFLYIGYIAVRDRNK